jgi:hypothetical protein
MTRIDYADRFREQLALVYPFFESEYRFAAAAVGGLGRGLRGALAAAGLRDWRFDVAFVAHKISIEIDGGGRMAAINSRTGVPVAIGRHAQSDDYRKLNAAARLGWRVLRYTPEMLDNGEWISDLEAMLK